MSENIDQAKLFFDACETGKGWEVCQEYCLPNATFSAQAGAIADIAVLDPATILDKATFDDPHQYADGAQHVFVSGEAVLLNGEMTGARPGKVLRSK